MTNKKLITDAVNIILNYYKAENIFEPYNQIARRVTEWYNKSEITNKYQLAAVAIESDYYPATWDWVIKITNFYFNNLTIDNNNYIAQKEDNLSLTPKYELLLP